MKLNIGHKLLAIREERKLTQNEIADLLGVSTSKYQRIEKGESSLELDQIVNFAKQLSIPIIELLPEILTIHNNNNGQGGLIFGDFHYYANGNERISQLEKENEYLKKTLNELKASIDNK